MSAPGGILPLRGDHWTARLLDVHLRSAMSAQRRLAPSAEGRGLKFHAGRRSQSTNRFGLDTLINNQSRGEREKRLKLVKLGEHRHQN